MKLLNRFVDIATRPIPLRTLLARRLFTRFPLGDYRTRLLGGAVNRPWYGWCLYQAAIEAKGLGYKAFTAIELGVAGGSGLVCLCDHKEEIERAVGIKIMIQGFDTGSGLPDTRDPRDLLYCWPPGSFEMDQSALKKRLAGRAEVLFGDVADTVKKWEGQADAPLGAIMFDLDFYTSTRGALPLLTKSSVLPRLWCYMDDISGYGVNAYSDSIGVRLAIKEFNQSADREHFSDHLSQAFAFEGMYPEGWHQQIYVYHRLSHPYYNRLLSDEKHQLRLV